MTDTREAWTPEPSSFREWSDARASAQSKANAYGFDYSIEKMREYGRTVYRVFGLPKSENRYGFELRCEVVRPEVRAHD